MLTVNLHTATGERLTIQVKTGWEDITAAEYIAMQGKEEAELLQWLTGLDAQQLAGLDNTAALYFAELLSSFTAFPEAEVSIKVEAEAVGKFEAAKKTLARLYREDAATYRVKALPGIYAAYHGIYAREAMALPAAEVVPVALKLLEQIEAVSRKYDKLLQSDEANDEAGEDRMAGFGFYPLLHLLAGGDILKHDAIMQLSVKKVYTELFFRKELAHSQKENA